MPAIQPSPQGSLANNLGTMGHDRVDSRHDAGDGRGYDQHRLAGHADPGQRQALVDDFADLRHADARNRSPVEARQHRPHQRRPVDGKLHPGLVPEERLDVGHRGNDRFSLLCDGFALVAEHVLHVQHPLHGPRDLLGGERLGHVVASAEAHRRGRVGDAGITGDDQHRNVRLLLAEPFEELDSIHVGHLDVQEDDRVVVFRSLDEALPRDRCWFRPGTLVARRFAGRPGTRLPRRPPPAICVRRPWFVPLCRRVALFGRAGWHGQLRATATNCQERSAQTNGFSDMPSARPAVAPDGSNRVQWVSRNGRSVGRIRADACRMPSKRPAKARTCAGGV